MHSRFPAFNPWFLTSLVLGLVAPSAAHAQYSDNVAAIVAGMREDMRILDERTRALTVEIEQLKRENRELRESVNKSTGVSLAQFNSAVAELEKAIRAGDRDLALQITKQMERLATQTQAALDAMAKGGPGGRVSAPAPVTFTDDHPKSGITYTVQAGDTLANIAQRNNSTVPWIQNANRITDPRALQVGQTLFVPQK